MSNVNHLNLTRDQHSTERLRGHPSRPTSPHYLPVRSNSNNPSPSTTLDYGQWPMPYIVASSDTQSVHSEYSVTMPEPRLVQTPALGSSAPKLTSDEHDHQRKNPLVDLMDSEKIYLHRLELIIRRAAEAWSRQNLPPPKLDTMFRCIEACYRANKGFGLKLKKIGPNPSNPKALGDLLMRWIDDLEPAYQSYTSNFFTGFDSYPPVSTNTGLSGILMDISASSKPDPPLRTWSLDALFVLPYSRLRYYRKLYARLLRSTQEGRNDHGMLMAADERLNQLIKTVEMRLEMDAGDKDGDPMFLEPVSKDRQWSERGSEKGSIVSNVSPKSHQSYEPPLNGRMNNYSNRDSHNIGAVYFTQQLAATQGPDAQSNKPSETSLSDLELRIDTGKTIDLFTMQSKRCRLQIQPPTLPYERSLRSSHDVSIYFTPSATARQVEHRRAHIFILSDLLLVAEWMDATDKAAKMQQIATDQPERVGKGGPMPEMWLRYPPLAGKHLMVAEGHQANVLTVMIMRKETFAIHTESEIAKDQILRDLSDCSEYTSVNASSSNISNMPRSASSSSTAAPPRTAGATRFPSPFSTRLSPFSSAPTNDVSKAMSTLSHQLVSVNVSCPDGIQWPEKTTEAQQPTGRASSPTAVLPPRSASLRTSDQGLSESPRAGFGQMRSPAASQPPTPLIQMTASQQQNALPGSRPSSRYPFSHPMIPDLPGQWRQPPRPVMSGLNAPSSHSNQGNALSQQLAARYQSSASRNPVEPPSAMFQNRFPCHDFVAEADPVTDEDTPPPSPKEKETGALTGPAIVSAQMKCKVFIKQAHQQWKPLGAGKLRLYTQTKGNVKQLVVESDSSSKQILVSTIVLTDGVERVAKTGVAVEISDRRERTGIVYMIQLKNENSAIGLFESLLVGSDRTIVR
ncbi:hypothetical protein IAR50_006450 [Cryptococcus sp. DSM 104548]